ncbi:hypothetical protein RFI_00167 [Reticulomyxa filosa]|uniref:Uncharacterized protein n=1 Tax=Reticulomyxa filosa TaxID=46433 RepID=X6PEJ4_RETFI|nr:hypothetical protein RFI_00167 [Reticulomyxa filosa]|eukprot:ETO36895.1 hypothetical protein RFI_00167 [Reticulomyxa filosa]
MHKNFQNRKAYALFATPNEAHLVRAEFWDTLLRGRPLMADVFLYFIYHRFVVVFVADIGRPRSKLFLSFYLHAILKFIFQCFDVDRTLDEAIAAQEFREQKFDHLKKLKVVNEPNTKATLQNTLNISFQLMKSNAKKINKNKSKLKQKLHKPMTQIKDVTEKKKKLTNFLDEMDQIMNNKKNNNKEKMDEDKAYTGGVLLD